MRVFYQHQIDEDSRIGIWKIEETEEFFKNNVPAHREVTHPHKRLQHLAGRFLLQYLFPDFPYELIQIADTNKPYLADEKYHFSISHCGDWAAAIVSRSKRVGVDVEIPTDKTLRLKEKFLSVEELGLTTPDSRLTTLLWSAKESVFKWHGDGAVDFKKHIQLSKINYEAGIIDCLFAKTGQKLSINHIQFDKLVLAWVIN